MESNVARAAPAGLAPPPTLEALRLGALGSLPLGVSVFAYGLVFGILAGQVDMSILESMLMSTLVFAGASQFVVLDLWVDPLPVGAIVLAALAVNLRHVLMGAAMRPWLAGLSPFTAYGSLFFLVDESWALSMREVVRGKNNIAFLVGSGLVLFVAWNTATVVGRVLGEVVSDPALYGLDFAFTAVFLAMLAGLWRGREDILPWGVAALAAVLADQFLPGKWYILIGALAGSLTVVVRRGN